jgi:hypothetical protein
MIQVLTYLGRGDLAEQFSGKLDALREAMLASKAAARPEKSTRGPLLDDLAKD